MNNTAHHMSAQAVDAVTLLRLDAASLRREMRAEPGLAMTVLASIHHQFDMLITEVELLTSRSGLQRVAEFLLVLATCSSGRCSVGPMIHGSRSRSLTAGRCSQPVWA